MPRIFACLAIGELILFVGNGVLGLLRLPNFADRHVLLGVFALLLACLIQVVAFTYLTVTGKMIGQAVHIGRMGLEPLAEAKILKRKTSRLLALGIVSILAVVISGAVHWRSGAAAIHQISALALLIVHGWVLLRQYELVAANSRLFDRTLREYTNRRREKSPFGVQHAA